MTSLKRRSKENERPRDSEIRQSGSAGRRVITVGLAVALIGTIALPARAHVRVFLGFGLPVAPYPYAYSYAPPRCDAPYPPYVAYGAVPPPAWVPGYWTWRVGPWGRRARAWVPARVR
jgi:hypothetical protein